MPKRDDPIYPNMVPPLGPTDALSYNQQLQELHAQWRDLLTSVRLQAAQAKSGFRSQRGDIRRAMRTGLTEAEGAALDRGTLGSSTDLQERVGVRGQAQRAVEDARGQKQTSLAQLALAKQQGRRNLDLGIANVESMKSAAQAMQAIQQFQEGTLLSGGGQGPGFPDGGRGTPGMATAAERGTGTLFNDLLVQLKGLAPGSPRRAAIVSRLFKLWGRWNNQRAKSGKPTEPQEKLIALINAYSPFSQQRLGGGPTITGAFTGTGGTGGGAN